MTPDDQAARDAIRHRLDETLFVEAGAGTGKTWVLVRRFLHLLEMNPTWPIESIVAVTFTEKAAGELKLRLREALEKERAGTADDEVRERLDAIEQQLVSARRVELLGRLAAAQGQAEKAARGIRHVLEAINGKRVEVLFVVEGAGQPGWRSSTGPLALHEDEARAYGEPVEPVADVIDEIIEKAVRAGSHIELFRDDVRLDGHPVAALLRF